MTVPLAVHNRSRQHAANLTGGSLRGPTDMRNHLVEVPLKSIRILSLLLEQLRKL